MSKVGVDYPQPPPPAYPGPQPGYPAAQPGYPAGAPPPYQPQPGSSTVVITQPIIHGSTVRFGQHSACIQCQHCGAQVTTSTSYVVGTATWLICFFICIIGFWFFCCLIPFCIDACKDVIHTCPNCKATVGRYSPM